MIAPASIGLVYFKNINLGFSYWVDLTLVDMNPLHRWENHQYKVGTASTVKAVVIKVQPVRTKHVQIKLTQKVEQALIKVLFIWYSQFKSRYSKS